MNRIMRGAAIISNRMKMNLKMIMKKMIWIEVLYMIGRSTDRLLKAKRCNA